MSVSSERYCGNGHYCAEGTYCKDGGCRSHAADEALRELRRVEDELRAEQERLADEARKAEERSRAAANPSNHSGSCSTITGPGMSSGGPCNNDRGNGPSQTPPSPPNTQQPPQKPQTKLVLVQPAPSCPGCRALDAVAEILPLFGSTLKEMDEEINSPNIPPPQDWLTHPPSATNAARTNSHPDQDNEPDTTNAQHRQPSSRPSDDTSPSPDSALDEAEDDYAVVCDRAFKEYLSGNDDLMEKAKQEVRDLKKARNSLAEAIRHPYATAKRLLQDYIDEHLAQFDPHNYFKILAEQALKSESKERQEDLKRFKEKWGEKCVERTYATAIEQNLTHVFETEVPE